MKKALMYLLVFVGLQFAVGAVANAVCGLAGLGGALEPAVLIISMASVSVITGAVFLAARWSGASHGYLRSRPWGVLVWSVLAAFGMIIPSAWLQEQMPELPNLLDTEFGMILKNRYGYFVVGLLAPLVEELVFRGAILRSLLTRSGTGTGSAASPAGMQESASWTCRPWTAIALSALMFALVHGNPAQMPHAFIVGLLLGWMYFRTDSIIPGVAYHWVNNTVAYVLYNVMPDPDAPLSVMLGGSGRSVALGLLFSLCILLPALFQLNMRMKKETNKSI